MFFLVFTVPSTVLGSEKGMMIPKWTQLYFRAKVQVGVYKIRFHNIMRNQNNLMEQKVKLNYI